MKKIILLGDLISRKHSREIIGGFAPVDDEDSGANCCGHSDDWVHFECGLTKAEAKASSHAFWCCASCHSSCVSAGATPCPV